MTETLSAIKIRAVLEASLENVIDGVVSATVAMGKEFSPATRLGSGTTANNADRYYQDASRALTSGTDEDLDLFDFGARDIGAGAGRSPLGQLNTWAELVSILVVNEATSAGDCHVGGEGSAAAFNTLFNGVDASLVVVKPGGIFFMFAPTDPAYAIADSTNHLLTVAAVGGDITYSIYLIGRSA